ncbi:MAG TPA: hypothetical protein VII28_13180 [Puia sp.]
MKKKLTILFFAITVSISCKKSNISPPILVGNWNWVSTFNDGAPGPLNPLTPINSGISKSLTFTNTGWVLKINNLIVESGTYTTSIAKDLLGENINRIRYYKTTSQTDSITYYSITRDTLIFSYDFSGSAGSGSSTYIKN